MSTISQKFADMIQDALDRGIGLGEDIEYDVCIQGMPGPGNQPQPVLGVAFTLPGTTLGEGHAIMIFLPPSVPDQSEVDEIVRRIVEGLVQTRSQVSQQVMQVAAQSNGHGPVPPRPSGLILPGQ